MPDHASHAAQVASLLLPLEELPDPLPIPVIERPFDVVIRPPGSKSLTNRALLLAALADGVSELRGALVEADDARVMVRAVEMLGARVEIGRTLSASEGNGGGKSSLTRGDNAGKTPLACAQGSVDIVRVTGVGGRWKIPAGKTVTLDLHNAGTATRFLTAAAILAPADSGGIIIDGDARMRERPIGELAAALAQLGVKVEYLGKEGCPPLRVVPPGDLKSLTTRVAFEDPQSSQFISAIMLVSIFLARPTTIELAGRVMSEPYIGMTQAMIGEVLLRQRGPKVVGKYQRGSGGAITLPMPVFRIKGFEMEIEPDASGATYFLGAAAIVPGAKCVIDGLPWVIDCEPVQGDAMFGGVLAGFGADERADDRITECTGPRMLHGIEWDFVNMPDTAMTAAVVACFASPTTENPTGVSTLHGLRSLRVKETDRIEAVRKELTKIGARVEVFREGGEEGIRITPPAPSSPHHLAQSGKVVAHPPPPPVHFETYNDHRMAMALALVGLRRPGVFIRDPGCVRKTYPTFWRDLAKLYQ